MPLIKSIKSDNSFTGIWHLTESTNMLSQMLRFYGKYNLPGHYTHQRRIAEWYAVRLILHEILPEKHFDIFYNEYGKPFLAAPEGFISISHTHGFVGVLFHRYNNCGFDMELLDRSVVSISHKFVRNDETSFLLDNPQQKTLMLWSAKEVIYKIYGKKSLDFKDNLRILPFEYQQQGEIKGQLILNNDICSYDIQYSFQDHLLTTIAIEK
mgnify:FL=1